MERSIGERLSFLQEMDQKVMRDATKILWPLGPLELHNSKSRWPVLFCWSLGPDKPGVVFWVGP